MITQKHDLERLLNDLSPMRPDRPLRRFEYIPRRCLHPLYQLRRLPPEGPSVGVAVNDLTAGDWVEIYFSLFSDGILIEVYRSWKVFTTVDDAMMFQLKYFPSPESE